MAVVDKPWADRVTLLLDGLVWAWLACLGLYLLAGRLPVPWVSGLDFPALGLAATLLARRALAGRLPLERAGWWRALSHLWEAATARPLAAAWAAGLLWGLVMAAWAVARYHDFQGAEDLGVIVQGLWSTRQGELLWCSLRQMSLWGEHFQPILLALAGVYALLPRPETLLVVQALALGTGAPAVVILARRALPPERQAWAFLPFLIYLAHPGLQGMLDFDFHPIALSTSLWLWFFALRLGRSRHGWLAWPLLGLALACGEESWVVLTGYGLYALTRRRWLEGLVCVGAGVAGFLVVTQLVVPRFNPYTHAYLYTGRFQGLGGGEQGGGMGAILASLLTRPQAVWQVLTLAGKGHYLLTLLAWGGFLTLLRPGTLLLFLPVVAGVMLSSYAPQWSFHQHYAACVVPGVVAGATLGLGRLLRWRATQGWSAGWACGLALLAVVVAMDVSPLGLVWRTLAQPTPPQAEVVAAVPPGAEVAAPKKVLSHLAGRWALFDLEHFPRGVPYVILCCRPDPWPLTPRQVELLRRRLVEREGYRVVLRQGPCWLLEHVPSRPVTRRGRSLAPMTGWRQILAGVEP